MSWRNAFWVRINLFRILSSLGSAARTLTLDIYAADDPEAGAMRPSGMGHAKHISCISKTLAT